MKILCVSDGSDDGFQTAELLARIIDRKAVDKIKILMVTWPQRHAALWKKAYGLWPSEDDLHQAMEVAVVRELERFRQALQIHAGSIETATVTGEPVSEVLEHAKLLGADLILVAITGDAEAKEAHRLLSEVIAKSPTPIVVAYGRSRPAGSDSGT